MEGGIAHSVYSIVLYISELSTTNNDRIQTLSEHICRTGIVDDVIMIIENDPLLQASDNSESSVIEGYKVKKYQHTLFGAIPALTVSPVSSQTVLRIS
jgi:hypothetical protein